MKTLRLCLLVLLAVLLPVRGAIAAAMLCPPTVAGVAHSGQMPAADHPAAQADDADAGEAGHAGHHPGAHEGGSCNLCCDFCSMTPLPSEPPTVATPTQLSTVAFPDLFAPAPSFLSDGQERPPRSI